MSLYHNSRYRGIKYTDALLLIQPNLLLDPTDFATMISAVELCLDVANEPVHPVGTCAMGIGDQFVVDSSLKVHGIENLRIADVLLCLLLLPQTPMRQYSWFTMIDIHQHTFKNERQANCTIVRLSHQNNQSKLSLS